MDRSFRSAAEIEATAVEEEWGSMVWMASRQLGNAAGLTAGRMLMRPGGVNPLHSHPDCEELVLLLRGSVEHDIGGGVLAQSPGDVIVIPPGVPHRTRNIGDCEAEIVITFSSGARGFQPEE